MNCNMAMQSLTMQDIIQSYRSKLKLKNVLNGMANDNIVLALLQSMITVYILLD